MTKPIALIINHLVYAATLQNTIQKRMGTICGQACDGIVSGNEFCVESLHLNEEQDSLGLSLEFDDNTQIYTYP